MDIQIGDMRGKSMGSRQMPVVPRQGDILMLPMPTPDDPLATTEIERAKLLEAQPYLVKSVVFDVLGHRVTVIVEETARPPLPAE